MLAKEALTDLTNSMNKSMIHCLTPAPSLTPYPRPPHTSLTPSQPYYFNHLMALQMTGSHAEVVIAPSTEKLHPDLVALRAEMEARRAEGRAQIKMVTITNPGNPTGVMIPEAMLKDAQALCVEHGTWLVMDNVRGSLPPTSCRPFTPAHPDPQPIHMCTCAYPCVVMCSTD